MYAPFNLRHAKAFKNPIIKKIVDSISVTSKNVLQLFSEKVLEYAQNSEINNEIRFLVVDMSICSRNFEQILHFTENLERPEYFLYRAYAYSRMQQTSKIASLKLQFQQKFLETLTNPRNTFILKTMEFFLLYGEKDFESSLIKLEENEEILNSTDELNNKLFTNLFLTLAAQTYLLVNSLSKVEETSRNILQSAIKQKDPYFQSVALNLITNVLISRGNFRKAQRILNSAIIPTEETGLAADRASLLTNSAKLELARGNYQRSIKLLNQIFKLVAKNPRSQAITALNITELHIILKEYEHAELSLDLARTLDELNELKLVEPYLYDVWLKIEQDRLTDAENLIKRCHEIVEDTGEARQIPTILYFEGMLKKKINLIPEAIEKYQMAFQYANQMQNIEILIKSQFQLASIFLEKFKETKELADYSNVLNYLNNLVVLSEEQFVPRLMCDIHIIKGLVFAQGEKIERALEDLDKARELASRFGYKSLLNEIKSLIADLEIISEDKESDKKSLEEKGFKETKKMEEVLSKYLDFKFVKNPRKTSSKLYGVAIVETQSGVINYKYATDYEEEDEASLTATVIAAVNMFSNVLLEEEIMLKEAIEENNALMIEQIEDKLIICVSDNISLDLKIKFEEYIKKLKQRSELLKELESSSEILNEIDTLTKKHFD